VSPRRIVEARSDQTSPRTFVVSSSLAFSVSTDDPSLSLMSVPGPALSLTFKGGASAPFLLAPAAAAQIAPARRPSPPAEPKKIRDAADPPDPAEGPPPPEPPAAVVESSEPQTAPEADEPEATKGSSEIELIIDSLPNHTLSKPIPVAIVSLGDKVFTASVNEVGIHATGYTIGEALLVLKEQIEEIYADLNRAPARLDAEQKATLELLHTYIAPRASENSRRGKWF
jgi:hypothetical protein